MINEPLIDLIPELLAIFFWIKLNVQRGTRVIFEMKAQIRTFWNSFLSIKTGRLVQELPEEFCHVKVRGDILALLACVSAYFSRFFVWFPGP